MSDPFDDLDELTPEEVERLRSVYQFTDPLGESRERQRLVAVVDAEAASSPSVSEAAQERGRTEVREAMGELLSEESLELRRRNQRGLRLDGSGTHIARLNEVALALDAMQLEAHGTVRYLGDYAEIAAADILQGATATCGAIALLLAHGFVLDAEARWRGLHELACVTTLLAEDPSPIDVSARYLAHGERLPFDDPAYDTQWAKDPSFSDDHEWLRATHPHLSKKGKPIRFTQRWIFDQAALSSAPFDDWISSSHAPVHMSSNAVARGRKQSGEGDPPGFDAVEVEQVCFQTASSVSELVTSASILLIEALPPERLLGWSDEFHDRADAIRPSPHV